MKWDMGMTEQGFTGWQVQWSSLSLFPLTPPDSTRPHWRSFVCTPTCWKSVLFLCVITFRAYILWEAFWLGLANAFVFLSLSQTSFPPPHPPPHTHTHTHTQSCLYCFCAIGPLSNQLIPFSLASSPGEVPENTHRMKKWTALGFFPFYSIILQVLPT